MKVVICEGKDDMAVIQGLVGHSQIGDLQLEQCGGRDNLGRYLTELPKRPDFARGEVETLAVVIDAESDGQAAWSKLTAAVSQGFGVTLTDQELFIGERPKIAGFIVSRNSGRGMIEDLCLQAVSDQPGYACLELYFECLAERTDTKEYHAKSNSTLLE